MKTITKKQKIAAYKYAIEGIKNELWSRFVCDNLNYWGHENVDDWSSVSYGDRMHLNFPEFMKLKPIRFGASGNWWPLNNAGRQKRIDVLTKIVEQLENK